MATVIRECTKCGNRDMQNRWDSMDHAIAAGAMSSAWTCPNCAWTEAELVELNESKLERALVHAGKPEEGR